MGLSERRHVQQSGDLPAVLQEYGKSHDGLAPLCLNLRRNGLMTPWGYYALHEPYQLTLEDYLTGRVIEEPLVIYDCDRPVYTCAAFISPPLSVPRT